MIRTVYQRPKIKCVKKKNAFRNLISNCFLGESYYFIIWSFSSSTYLNVSRGGTSFTTHWNRMGWIYKPGKKFRKKGSNKNVSYSIFKVSDIEIGIDNSQLGNLW